MMNAKVHVNDSLSHAVELFVVGVCSVRKFYPMKCLLDVAFERHVLEVETHSI